MCNRIRTACLFSSDAMSSVGVCDMIGSIIMTTKARSGFKNLNDRDLDRFMKSWAEDAVFVYPGHASVSGEHAGKRAIRSWWAHFLEQFPQAHFTCHNVCISRCFAMGSSNDMTLAWSVRTTNRNGKEFANKGVSTVKIVGGKIKRFEDYFFSTDTIAEAWGDE